MNTHPLTQAKLIAAFKARDEMAAVITAFIGAHVYKPGVEAKPGRSHYQACAEGYVEIMCEGDTVETRFYNDDQLTGREIKVRSEKLSNELRAIIVKHKLPRDLQFDVKAVSDRSGSYQTYVELTLATPA
jgi:hypothetical protein